MQGNVLDMILPKRGERRPAGLPIWDESRHMFIVDEHESQAGHRSYKGVRVTDRFAIVEYIGNYHNWCYINAIELYANDGYEYKLVGKCQFGKEFYDAELIRQKTEEMMFAYTKSQYRMLNRAADEDTLRKQSAALIDSSYRSMINEDTAELMEQLTPLLPKETTYINL